MVMNSPEGSLAGPPRRDRRSFKSPNMAILRRGRHPRARHGSSSLLAPTFLLDSEEGSSPMNSSWEPETGSSLAALRRARTQEPEFGSAPMFLLDSEDGSCWCFDDQALGRRLEVSDPLFGSRSTK
jgi:hypothetical protein